MGINGNSSKKNAPKASPLTLKEEFIQNSLSDNEEKSNEIITSKESSTISVGGYRTLTPAKTKDDNRSTAFEHTGVDTTTKPEEPTHEDLKEAEEYLNDVIRETLVSSRPTSDKNIDYALLNDGQVLNCTQNELLLRKGDEGKGIFILLKGNVDILTSDNLVTIATLSVGDIFGEISTLFDVPCTTNVRASKGTVLFVLDNDNGRKIFEDIFPTMDVIDWCIRRRYLPTSDVIDSARAYRRMAFQVLKSLPLFNNWPDNAVKSLVLKFDHLPVMLYPQTAVLLAEGEIIDSIYVITRGTIVAERGPRQVAKVVISSKTDPFVYGESGVLIDNIFSALTIKCSTPCQVSRVRKEWILEVLKMFPDEEQGVTTRRARTLKMFNSLGHLYTKYEADLQLEILYHFLKRSTTYATVSNEILQKKIESGVFEEVNEGYCVDLVNKPDRFEAILVIRGEVLVDSNHSGNTELLDEPETLENDNDDKDKNNDIRKAKLLGKAAYKTIGLVENGDETGRTFKEGHVINVTNTINHKLVVKALTQCLALKLQHENMYQENDHKASYKLDGTALDFV